jgi:antitoxin component YwqK of YwqJK toxin-antitoxin module
MRNYLIIFYCLLFSFQYAQTVEPDLEYYNSGQLKWKGQKQCITIKDDKECKPIGFWVYYYKNGEKKLEKIEGAGVATAERFINMWQADGYQILKNGVGFYFEKENRGSGEWDSLAYQIKDSLKNGMFTHYRKHGSSAYYQIEYGNYSDSKREGFFKFKDTVQLYEEETNYDTQETSRYRYFYPNKKVKEEGKTVNSKKEGPCKYFNDQGVLVKEANFKNGAEFGEYKEYHDNGTIKVKGQYTQGKGFVEHKTFDPQGVEHIRKTASDNVPKKTGVWTYYDDKGNVTKSETPK